MKKRLTYLTIFFAGLIVILASFRDKIVTTIQVKNLRVEGLVNPKGIDATSARLSWEIGGEHRGLEQTAYQILVASTVANIAADKADIWNSGKVNSNQNVHVPLAGDRLKSRMEYYWKVKVWTNKGEGSYSSPAHFTAGLLDEKDWKAKWTGLDKSFPVGYGNKNVSVVCTVFQERFCIVKRGEKSDGLHKWIGFV
jgi:alpha-L-rhamnosidase